MSEDVIKDMKVLVVAVCAFAVVVSACIGMYTYKRYENTKAVNYAAELDMCKNMWDTDLVEILPEKVDLSAIHQFNLMSVSICNQLGYAVFPIETTEEQRCKM